MGEWPQNVDSHTVATFNEQTDEHFMTAKTLRALAIFFMYVAPSKKAGKKKVHLVLYFYFTYFISRAITPLVVAWHMFQYKTRAVPQYNDTTQHESRVNHRALETKTKKQQNRTTNENMKQRRNTPSAGTYFRISRVSLDW